MAAARFGANETECNGFPLGVHFKDSREAARVQRNLKCGGKRSATPLWAVCRWLVLRARLKAPVALRLAGTFQRALGQAVGVTGLLQSVHHRSWPRVCGGG